MLYVFKLYKNGKLMLLPTSSRKAQTQALSKLRSNELLYCGQTTRLIDSAGSSFFFNKTKVDEIKKLILASL